MSKKTYTQLNQRERYHLWSLKESGESTKIIAERLRRHRSTIYREIYRNKVDEKYSPESAHKQAQERGSKPQYSRISSELVNNVSNLIRERQWSPEQISGHLRVNENKQISHESIYKIVWQDRLDGGDLYTHLRHQAKKYNKRKGVNKRRGKIPNRRDIDERPTIVEGKTRIGDFELDTVIGANHKGALVTIVDRCSKLCHIIKIEQKTKELTRQAIEKALFKCKENVHSLTSDNGREFAAHQEIATFLDADFFFAKPYHSWQRGLNEHTNGLIRQYLPKKTDFTTVTDEQVKKIEILLNNRPRKVLNFKTPNQVWEQMAA